MSKTIEERDPNFKPQVVDADATVTWHPACSDAFTMRGLAWYEENDRALLRLPRRAEGIVREPVWSLAHCTAGARLCFRTDSTSIQVRATLLNTNVMSHMPLTGSSGLALYEGAPGAERPWPVAFPGNGELAYERSLFKELPRRMRTFTLYLPLYNGLESLAIGLDPDATIEPAPPTALPRPVVFYGTSITQGGCAHNPGADYPTILGRHLNLDTINLGFSGNGRGEPELAGLLAEIDAEAFVLDYVANAGPDGLAQTLAPFIDILRETHAETPIVIVSRIIYSQVHYLEGATSTARPFHERQRDICIGEYARRRAAGDVNIHFVDGNGLLPYGTDLAYSDAGVHPANTGFAMMADRLQPQLQYILRL